MKDRVAESTTGPPITTAAVSTIAAAHRAGLVDPLGPQGHPCWASRIASWKLLLAGMGSRFANSLILPAPPGRGSVDLPYLGPFHGAVPWLSPWRSHPVGGVGLHDPLNQADGGTTSCDRQVQIATPSTPSSTRAASLRTTDLVGRQGQPGWDRLSPPSRGSPPGGVSTHAHLGGRGVLCFHHDSRTHQARVRPRMLGQRPPLDTTPFSSIPVRGGRLPADCAGVVQRSQVGIHLLLAGHREGNPSARQQFHSRPG